MKEQIPCYQESRIYHPDSGSIKTCTLKRDTRVQGVLFPAGSILGFDREGRIWRCHISEETMIGGISCKAGSEVEFFRHGGPAVLTPSVDFKSDVISPAGGHLVVFHENGRLFRGVLAKDASCGGWHLKSGTEATFFDNGGLASFELAEDRDINSIPFMAGSSIWLFQNGAVRAGTICKDSVISGIPCLGGFPVWFHESGALAGGRLYEALNLSDGAIAVRGEIILIDEGGNTRGVLTSEGLEDFPPGI